ncbi:DUF423 domain-containing protein [Faunimonas sp. B44]|uniref:DUF423 domain-containing protein n=1 Tax=Faunimonas sp. B44 TaxID=3461493 RepID=UPI0040444B66
MPKPRSLADRILLAAAALCGGTGVAFGAAASHLTGGGNLAIASEFLLVHAAAVLALGALPGRAGAIRLAQAMLIVGVVVFAGTLALGGLLDVRFSPSPAPWGGTLMILGWLAAAAAVLLPGRSAGV